VAAAFETAVSTAEARGWMHDIALAHELAAACHFSAGDAAAGLRHAQQAAGSYARWGAQAKANDVVTWAENRHSQIGEAPTSAGL
jgi:hypothetical protein